MTLQDVVVSFKDGNLGILPEATDKIILFLGASSAGTVNTIYPINSPNLTSIGFGPLPEAVRHCIDNSGGPCYAMPLATTAGVLSAVTASGGGPTVTLTGNSFDAYVGKILITVAGVLGTSKFKYTLDGGTTYSDEIFTAATYPIPDSGITINFAAGTYVLDEYYSFTGAAPTYTTGQVQAALDAAFLDTREFGLVYLVGVAGGANDAAKATACAGFATAVGSRLASFTTSKHRYTRGIVEAPNVTDASLLTAFASFVDVRMSVIVGYGAVLSPITGRTDSVNVGRVLVSRLPKKGLGKDPSQVRTEDGLGALPSSLVSIARNEFSTPGLDSARFVTVRNYNGRIGFFVTNWPLMSQTGSDYKYLQHGQMADNFAKVVRNKLIDYLSFDLRVKDDGSGQLTKTQATMIASDCDSAARASLVTPGHATDIQVTVDETNNVISTETLNVKGAILPKAYPKVINLDVGYTLSILRS
jgi:hypothetical protein